MKTMVLCTLFLVTCLTDYSHAEDWSWSKEDTELEIVFSALRIIDMLQTFDIKNHDEIVETHPYLVKNFTNESIFLFMISTAALHTVASKLLPRSMYLFKKDTNIRKIYQYTTIGISASTVASNFSIGLSAPF